MAGKSTPVSETKPDDLFPATPLGPVEISVGGVWRSFARVDMEELGYPLHVLHNYEIPYARAVKMCKVVAQLSRKYSSNAAAPKTRRRRIARGSKRRR